MRAAVFEGVGQPLSIKEVGEPKVRDGDVVLKVQAVGVCGSDLHATEDGAFLQASGTILGHEFSGEVVESGDPQIAVGTRATAVPIALCDECRSIGECKKGLGAVCPHSTFTGLDLNNQGAYAERVAVHASRIVPLPDSVSYEQGALVEPLAVGLHAVDMSRIKLGDKVLIIGAGPIGLSVLTFAKLAGAGSLIVSELAEARREIATDFGADGTIDAGKVDDVAAEFERMTGSAPDVIFECVGVPGLIRQCIDIIRPQGTLVVAGVCMKDDQFLPLVAALKEVRIQFIMAYGPKDFERVLQLLGSGKIDADKMITTRTGFDGLAEEFEKLRSPGQQIKLMIHPNG